MDTIKKNKPQLPVEFVAVKKRPEKSVSLASGKKRQLFLTFLRNAKMSLFHPYNLMIPLTVKQEIIEATNYHIL